MANEQMENLSIQNESKSYKVTHTINNRMLNASTPMVKNNVCSSRGLEFSSQQPHSSSQPSVMVVLLWCVWRQLQCTHMNKINESWNEKEKKDIKIVGWGAMVPSFSSLTQVSYQMSYLTTACFTLLLKKGNNSTCSRASAHRSLHSILTSGTNITSTCY